MGLWAFFILEKAFGKSVMKLHPEAQHDKPWRKQVHDILYRTDTPGGKIFDIGLIVLILISVLVVLLESVSFIQEEYGRVLYLLEWGITLLFILELSLRLIAIRHPFRYFFSFFGIIDFLSILPAFLSLFISGGQSLMVIRVIRLLRVFRIFKLVRYMKEAHFLAAALKENRPKIIVFLGGVLTLVVIMGAVMYLVEGEENGFTSIPKAMYWAIVTLTTVGYGDVAPQTILGQIISSMIMILGYSIIAVPTGLVTVSLSRKWKMSEVVCDDCGREGHESDAKFCKFCGEELAQVS